MSRKAKHILPAVAVLTALSGLFAPASADVTGRPHDLSLSNPKGHCINCHDLHQTKLGEGYAHNLKRANEMEVCYQCHAGALNNYSSIDPSYRNLTGLYSHYDIRSEFNQAHVHFPRYGMDGEHNKCSECHNPHGVFDHTSTTRRPKLLSAGPDVVTETDEYCFVCHNNDASPPHQKFSNISVGSQYRFSRTAYKGMTHSTFYRATTVTEPVPDTARTYDDNPYGKGMDISCLTCHRPHGSPNDHMLKSADNQNFCLACHNGSKAASLTSFTTSGHGKTGVKRICQECHFPHGTGQENAVKKTIRDSHTSTDVAVNISGLGMNEACYACHTAASLGRYYMGKSDYNAGIHKTGPNSHNPADTSGDQAPGDCDNCHNPHGTVMRYGKMLVAAQDQSLCYLCHNEATRNTSSGKDVKAAFLHMSSRHDLTKVKCVNCHNVHKATQAVVMMNPFKPQSTITDTNTFCLKCHSGTMPSGVTGAPNINAEWQNKGHDTTHVLTCSDCHDSHGSPNKKTLNYEHRAFGGRTANFARGMSFSSRAFCEACHNRASLGYKGAKVIPTGAGFVAQHGQGDSTSCSSCHTKKHNPTLAGYTSNSTYYTTRCLDCHTQGTGNPYPYPDADFNTPTNGSDPNTKRSIHDIAYSPPATVDCVKCHGSNHEVDHRTTNKIKDPDPTHGMTGMSSIRTTSVFCLECHDATPRKLGTYSSPTNILDTYTSLGHGDATAGRMVCYACHEYHGSVNEKLIKAAINGKSVMPIYSGNNVSVCTACHKGYDSRTPQWSGYTVYSGSVHAFGNTTTGNLLTDGRHGPGVCVNCHNPHGAKVDGVKTSSMLNKKQEELCYTCHASGFDNFSTPGDYNNKWNRFGKTRLIVKKESKALHYGRNVFGRNTSIWDGLASSNSFKDKDAAISVKLKMKELTRSDGYEAVGLRIEDARDSSKYMNVYYRAQSGAAWVSRYSGDSGPVSTALFGDEGTGSAVYHTLKFVRKKATNEFEVWVDGSGIRDNGIHNPNAVVALPSGYFKVMLFCSISSNTDATSETMEAWFDDFKVNYTSDGSAHNTASGDDVQDRFYMKTHHAVSDADQLGKDGVKGTSDDPKIECMDCHDPHTITEKLMAFKNASSAGGRSVVPVEADQHFCLKCHTASPPQGVRFPSEGVWDKSQYDLSAHGNPMKRDRTFGNYSNGVTYPCKACHNPHGSNQAALQRESWDINRDGIPDDIDGDGVLDSSTMVGFIGYSTGTRKPVLVNSTTGIPSRRGFRRVSTTIPYQGNGTIDVELCLNCHDGSPAPNVKKDFQKLSHHDVTYADQVADGYAKIECYNCHDQHRAQARNDSRGEYQTTNPDPPREPMPGDAPFCLKCHDNTLPPGVSFGNKTGGRRLKNIKLSYNPYNKVDANGYDVLTTYQGHYVQSGGAPLMCRECHNQHGSNYEKMIRDDTEPSKPGYDSAQDMQKIEPVALRPDDPMGGGDAEPLSSTVERCLACHSGGTTYKGRLLPLPPPPDSASRHFPMSPVGKHPDMKFSVTTSDVSGGHIYKGTFAIITTPGSVKERCTTCHDSHNPYISTVEGLLMDCYQCHNENTSLPDVQSEFNDNPTNPARSKSIHQIKYDPAGTTPAYVECLKCHDQTKHMQGRVRLRKDPSQFINYTSDTEVWVSQPTTSGKVDSSLSFTNSSTINRFCLECHDTDTTVASSFWRGGTEHVPPRLPAEHARGAHSRNGRLLCTDCHEYHGSPNNGLRKKTRGDQETFCFSCHNNPANSKDGVNIMSKFTTTNSRHILDSAGQAAAKSKVECENCHNPHIVNRTSMVVSPSNKAALAASDDSFCVACHGSTGVQGVRFPGYTTGVSAPEWDAATGKWNKWNKAGYAGYTSHNRYGVYCRNCHDPHGSANYAMLLGNTSTAYGKGSGIKVGFGVHSTGRGKRGKEELGVNDLCKACHKNSIGAYDGYASYTGSSFGHKKGIDKNCTYCHNPHGSSQDSMIRAKKPLYMNMTSAMFGSAYNFRAVRGFNNSTTGQPYYTFCSSRNCHKGTNEGSTFDTFNMNYANESGGLTVDNYSHDETVVSHHPIREGVITCASCHKEHGTSGTNDAPDLRAPYYRQSNWPQFYHTGVGQYPTATYVHGCNGCYGPRTTSFDGSNYWDYYTNGSANNHRNAIITPSTPSWANDLCFSCHQKEDIIGTSSGGMTGANTNFKGHEAVAGGATMSVDISYKQNKSGTDYHNFSCSECHYAHASRKGKLLKHSCMSQYKGDSEFPYTYDTSYGPKNYGGSADLFNCHSYRTKTGTYWGNSGWRDVLMSPTKADFKRPPNPVTDLAASSDTDLTIHLNWTAVADAPGAKADHYNVYRYSQPVTQAAKPYATRIYKGGNGTGGNMGSAMTWTDATGQPNTTYYYAVVACDSENNESFLSNCASVSLGPDTIVPAPIYDQQLAQVDGTFNVKLSWHDPGDNVNVTRFNIYRIPGTTPLTAADVSNSGNLITPTPVSDTSQSTDGGPDSNVYTYTDTSSQLNNAYSYAVMALDAANNSSALPTGSAFSISIVDPPPASVTMTSVTPVSKQMSAALAWTVPTNQGLIRGYHVYRKAGSAPTQSDMGFRIMSSITTTTATDANVPATATSYYYTIVAIDDSSGKKSSLGNSLSVNIPSPPANLVGGKQPNSMVQLRWTAPAVTTNLQNYKVYMRRNAGTWIVAVPTVAYPTTTATVSLYNQEPGTCDFAVTANYSAYSGVTNYESLMSGTVSLNITDTLEPASFTVSGALASPNYTQASVTWTAPSDRNFTGYTPEGLDGYRVEASYDQGSTWTTLLMTRLSNPSFESFTGTADDSSADNFTGWTPSNVGAYAVTDSLFDGKAMKVVSTGSSPNISSAESNTGQALANKTYSMSFWAKANKPGVSFQYCIQASGGSEQVGLTTATAGPEWQRFTSYGVFSGSVTQTAAKAVIYASADTSAELYIDGVRLDTSNTATLYNDGSLYQPSGYNTPGSAQTFNDWNTIAAGTSVKYRVKAVDRKTNLTSGYATSVIYAKPTPISDLRVASSPTTSANILAFSPPVSLAGIARYKVYVKEQPTLLTSLTGAILLDTVTPSVTSGANIAPQATASASNTGYYSPSYAIDGNTSDSTYWPGVSGVSPQYLTLTFSSLKNIYKVSFVFYYYSYYQPKDYLIQTNDGSGWVTQKTVTNNTETSPTYTFDKPVKANQVRLYITDTRGGINGWFPIVDEFMVYPGETYVHDLQNATLKAEAGHTYSYAVIAEDVNGLASDLSGGSTTVATVPDRDAPDRVTDLSLASPVGTTKVVLSWTTPVDNKGYGTTGARQYEVYRLPTSSVGTPAPVTDDNFGTASLVASGTYASSVAGTFNNYTATWYDHKGVYYAVRSADSAGNWSKISNSPFVTVGKDVQAPTPPVITNCVPGVSPEVDVYWSPAVDNVEINGYRLYRADSTFGSFSTAGCITENNIDQAQVAVNLIPYNATSVADTGGTPGKTYYYALRAWDNENNMSNISNCGIATVSKTATDTTPPAWSGTPLTATQGSYPDIDLLWTSASDLDDSGGAGSIDSYDVYRSASSFSAVTESGVAKIATVSAARHSYIDNTGVAGTTYYYGLVASDASANHNQSALSNVASAAVKAAPSPDNIPPALPTGLSASTGVYPYINLAWTASTDVDDASAPQQLNYYKLYRSDYPLNITDSNKDNPAEVHTIIIANDAAGYVARGVGGAKYNFRIEAFDLAGNHSGLSSQVTGQVAAAPCTDTTAPTAPSSLTATVGPSPDMALSWTASTDSGSCAGVIDHYVLYRSGSAITSSTDLRTLVPIYIAGNSASYTDSTGAPNTQYWYVLTAVDSSNNESGKSNIVTKMTAADTMAPAAIADLKAAPTGSLIRLTWCRPSDNVGIDHYGIYRKEQSSILTDADITSAYKVADFVNGGACLSYDNTGVLSGHTYSYAVIAVDGAGNRSTISRGRSSGDTIAAMP